MCETKYLKLGPLSDNYRAAQRTNCARAALIWRLSALRGLVSAPCTCSTCFRNRARDSSPPTIASERASERAGCFFLSAIRTGRRPAKLETGNSAGILFSRRDIPASVWQPARLFIYIRGTNPSNRHRVGQVPLNASRRVSFPFYCPLARSLSENPSPARRGDFLSRDRRRRLARRASRVTAARLARFLLAGSFLRASSPVPRLRRRGKYHAPRRRSRF